MSNEILNPDSDVKEWVDNATYHSLLEKWRMAPAGDRFFQGDNGKYYSAVMREKRDAVGTAHHIQASKSIGWGVA